MSFSTRNLNSFKAAFFLTAALLPSLLLAEGDDAAKGDEMNPLAGDTWLIAAWGKITAWAKSAWEWFSGQVHSMLIVDLDLPNAHYPTLIIIVAVLSIMLASGAWAASIAMMRRHPPVRFFLLGFFTFFIGPAHLLYSLEILGEKEQKEAFAAAAAQKRAEEEERARKEAAIAKAHGIETSAVSAEGVVWDKHYFESIQRKPDGTPDGPWIVTYNGITVTVTEIVEALDECVQVKLINLEGNPMGGRIPYAKLDRWDVPTAEQLQAMSGTLASVAAKEAEAEAEKAAKAAAKATAEAAAEGALVWNKDYFLTLQRGGEGVPAAPWKVTYNDITITVTEITEALDECVQVKMINLEGNPMVGRIPYARIQSWNSAE